MKTSEITNSIKTKEISNTSKVVYETEAIKNRFNFANRKGKKINRVRLTTALLRFAGLYGPKKMWQRYLIIGVCALFQGFFSLLLIQNTGLYNFGISSITQGLARITFVELSLNHAQVNIKLIYQLVFWVLYLIINIPLIVFSWFKIGKRFTLLTTTYLLTTNIFGFCLGLIPGIENIALFTNTNQNIIQTFLEEAATQGDETGPANKLLNDPNFMASLAFVPVLWNVPLQANQAVALLCYGLVFTLSSVFFYTVIFVIGGSTGGTDFISQWFARTRHKSIGSILIYVNVFTLTIGILLGSFIPGSRVLSEIPNTIRITGYVPENEPSSIPTLNSLAWSAPLYFSPNVIATLLSSILFAQIMDAWFPRYRLARVEIYTDKTMEIRSLLLNDDHPHSLSIQDIVGGYSLDHRQIIVTISMYIEVPHLIRKIRSVDKNCLVSITTIRGVDGYIYLADEEANA